MAEIVNLRHARKRKLRADRDREAAENRAKFGRAKPETERAAAVSELERRRLEQHRLKPEPEPES